MFGSESQQKVIYYLVVMSECRCLLFIEVDKYSRVDTGDAVENGFGEIAFPFIFPGGDDVLHFCVSIDDAVWY